ncbi:MAG TPA: glycosyltransferase family 2 protein [Nevskiaceae bacterium]|nr:glycosyltransferase family 2 protein [Nevskiaceae bacterium]
MTRQSVSLVIPAYNEERHLSACLDAIAAQTQVPLEVIVVDNNSTDRTAQVARAYPFVKVISERRQGRVFARNAGFNAAKGNIIGRIDADIVLPPNWIEYIQAFYTNDRHYKQAWTGGGVFYNVRFPRLVGLGYSLLAFRFNWVLLGHCSLWGSNMALLRSQWQTVAGAVHLRNDIHEDLDLTMHLHSAGYGIVYDSRLKVRAQLRRIHANRHELWGYLLWWPRTLRVHGKKVWIICWFFGVLLLYVMALSLAAADWVARRILGRKPLPTN